ncbi:TfoX/Sxy family protein [Nocardia sp. NBC_01503]|uniref:TfoX/Sxy family protein n=1 Tax=Nocardia sp. NBC_01503 TaxID=2975997 RepID=UPI002E7AC75F|nr:TfoX/Sxy family protein [Nocardia sp. NBC_01503]WTL31966.1 TfoX/Sxy family protein [Nocardia sp. NBC_01503]
MAYDEKLADRIRDALGPMLPEVVEKKMFGGLAFLLGGNMAVAASGKGGLLVRVSPEHYTDLLVPGEVETMVMGGRETRGWLRVTAETVENDAALIEWVERGIAFAGSLPVKNGK